jgi:raffinose/stachyose/melibiose transport system substrate-binding protein
MWLNQVADPNTIIKELKAGTFDLAGNATFNGYLETMTLLASAKYNKYGAQPLGSYYDDAHTSVGAGTSAMLFNGNWAIGSFNAPEGAKFGFMPVPVDNDPANPLNNKICAGATQTYIVNADASPAQIAAAKTYLNWLVDSDFGKTWLVTTCNVISPFTNNALKVPDSLGAAIGDAIAAGKTMSFTTNYVNASDWFTLLGPEVQKFIDKKSTAADLAKAITDYYKGLSS